MSTSTLQIRTALLALLAAAAFVVAAFIMSPPEVPTSPRSYAELVAAARTFYGDLSPFDQLVIDNIESRLQTLEDEEAHSARWSESETQGQIEMHMRHMQSHVEDMRSARTTWAAALLFFTAFGAFILWGDERARRNGRMLLGVFPAFTVMYVFAIGGAAAAAKHGALYLITAALLAPFWLATAVLRVRGMQNPNKNPRS
ncbi:MAG: hypothetical protein AAGE52_25175 [Myxococcota bacterium]